MCLSRHSAFSFGPDIRFLLLLHGKPQKIVCYLHHQTIVDGFWDCKANSFRVRFFYLSSAVFFVPAWTWTSKRRLRRGPLSCGVSCITTEQMVLNISDSVMKRPHTKLSVDVFIHEPFGLRTFSCYDLKKLLDHVTSRSPGCEMSQWGRSSDLMAYTER